MGLQYPENDPNVCPATCHRREVRRRMPMRYQSFSDPSRESMDTPIHPATQEDHLIHLKQH